ncbi:MAG: hypothetical protein WBP89_03500, partial [Sedimenticolaceae bacterium]
VEQIPPAPHQMIEQGRLVFEQLVVTGVAQLRGFALYFGEGEKVFPCESVPDLWISPENPL